MLQRPEPPHEPQRAQDMVDISRLAPPTPQEIEAIAMLNTMWDGSLDTNRALALLRKHGNDLDRTATALIEGDTGDPDDFSDLPHLEPLEAPIIGPGPRTPPRKYSYARSPSHAQDK